MSLVINLEENTFYSINDIISIDDKKITDNYYILEIVDGKTGEFGSEVNKRMTSRDFDLVLKTFEEEIEKFIKDVQNPNPSYQFDNMRFVGYCDGPIGDHYYMVTSGLGYGTISQSRVNPARGDHLQSQSYKRNGCI